MEETRISRRSVLLKGTAAIVAYNLALGVRAADQKLSKSLITISLCVLPLNRRRRFLTVHLERS